MNSAASVAIVRPSNTTAYNAGDVIGNADSAVPANAGSAIHTFKGFDRSAGLILIGASLLINLSAIPSGMTSFRLHLYSAQPDAILDNAAWALNSSNDNDGYEDFIDLGSPVVVGSRLFVKSDGLSKPIDVRALNSDLFAQLVTNGGYTPTSGAAMRLKLYGVPAK